MRTFALVSSFLLCLSHANATDTYREPWHWSTDIPTSILSQRSKATVRDPKVFDRFHFRQRTTIPDLVSAFGVPDGFARQYPVTRGEGVPVDHIKAGKEAGTFRYALREGGELLVTVADFHTILLVTRYEKAGWRHDLYERPTK
jgi:hypothetical protein